jgi:magnesium transporter
MPELNWEYGYIFFWLMAVLITGILLLFFKRKKWL